MSKAKFFKADFNGIFQYWQSNNSGYVIVPEEYKCSTGYLIFKCIDDFRNQRQYEKIFFTLKAARAYILEKEAEV